MSAPPPELVEAGRWEREANEELRTAEVIAAHDELTWRVVGSRSMQRRDRLVLPRESWSS